MTNKQIVLMLKGLPASGKSTFARELVANNNNWIRVNADDIRTIHFKDIPFSKSREKEVFEWENSQIATALENSYNVVVDDTNGHPRHVERIQKVIDEFLDFYPERNAAIEWKIFDTSLAECIRRDKNRENSVGEKVIRRMWNDYFRPQLKEYGYIEIVSGLPGAYIFDVDGTLAKFPGKNPYDRDFSKDIQYRPVVDMVKILKNYFGDDIKIIITSGRKSKLREVTEKWLFDNGIQYDALFMRATNDDRKDDIVKRELFDKNIKNKYNVMAVFDDRSRVVDMWRDLGLNVFQVDYGDF